MPTAGIRAVKLKVVRLDRETRNRWRHLSHQCKRIRNSVWRRWITWHTSQGNAGEVSHYMVALRNWHADKGNGRGPKPKCAIRPMPPELEKLIRKGIQADYPDVNERPMSLTLQIVLQQLIHTKTVLGSFPKWMAILGDEEGSPASIRPQPIPFNARNAQILLPTNPREPYRLKLRIDRILDPERKIAKSTEDIVVLQVGRGHDKSSSSRAAILEKIAKAEYEFTGSNLVMQPATGQWYVHIAYRIPDCALPVLDPTKVAMLRAATNRPWWLRIDGYNHWLGGKTGRHVAHIRSQLLLQRWSRREAYKHASSARRGHGRKRAVGRVYLLQGRWRDFVKTSNQTVVKRVVEKCIDNGCGHLIYFQPSREMGKRKFLATAGKVPGREDSSGWDWSQVASLLESKCAESGIKVTIHKRP